jgi:maltose/moltooligosaccharide transporter
MDKLIKKPRLGFWQIWNLSFGFLGIQFGWGLQLANLSRIFQTLGADIDSIAILWIAAPVTGLIVQPIIGHWSDHTWGRLGRRRPFFLTGALLASIALVLMPNSSTLWMAAGLLWVLDASINISMEPFRAFVGDMLPSEQRTMGFAMQSFFIGIGSVVASLFPYVLANWFGVSNTAVEGQIPATVVYAFSAGGVVFLAAVLWTVLRVREYPPEEMARFQECEAVGASGLQYSSSESVPAMRFYRAAPAWMLGGLAITTFVLVFELEKELYILGVGMLVFAFLLLFAGYSAGKERKAESLMNIFDDLLLMPDTMKRLAWVQFFSWFALFSMFLYTTAAVTSHVYGTDDPTSAAFNDGANWVGVLFGAYNGVAALVAFALPVLARKIGRGKTHIVALLSGGVGLMSFYLIHDPIMLLLPMIGIGIAWAAVLSMPYAILTEALPASKFGIYMGIFNFFIVLPQIMAATIYGILLENLFGHRAIYVLITGGVSFFVAAALMLRVREQT